MSFLSLSLPQINKYKKNSSLYIVNVNAIDKDVVGAERRERERELMRSNSERDRSTNSMGRDVTREVNDHHHQQQQHHQSHHHQSHRDVSVAKYSCRGEVNTLTTTTNKIKLRR